MDYGVRIEAIARDFEALVDAVAAGPMEARVPSCPDFSVDDLAKHVGEVCGFWTNAVRQGKEQPWIPFGGVGPDGRSGWLRRIGHHLVAELRATPPATDVWTWHEHDQSAANVARRCNHELAIHRVDAQLARGAAEPVERELAADGIEEIFLMIHWSGRNRPGGTPGVGQTLHLHGTDYEPAEWLISLGPDGVHVSREHSKADLGLRGPVSDLEMLLYQRPTVGMVEQFGDTSVLDVFYSEFTFR